MFDNIFKAPRYINIPWTGDPQDYDKKLRDLGPIDQPVLVFNPEIPPEDEKLIYWLDSLPDNDKCSMLYYNDNWVAKLFPPYWEPHWNAYQEVEITKPTYVWRKNPDLDKLMTFVDDPIENHDQSPWDKDYELIWYLDPRAVDTDEKIWALSCRPVGRKIKGVKDMGYLTPAMNPEDYEWIKNPDLDDSMIFENDPTTNYIHSPWDKNYELVWYLDSEAAKTEEKIWAVICKPINGKLKGVKDMGFISPKFIVEYNPVLKELNYELDYVIPWYNFSYEHVWMLDRKHMQPGEEDMWAFKIRATSDPKGVKVIDYISPTFSIETNSELPDLNYDLDYTVLWHDLDYEHIWMLDRKHMQPGEEDMWAFKLKSASSPRGVKIVDYIAPVPSVEINHELPDLNYDLDYVIPWHDLDYEHVWMLDDKSINDKVWVTKIKYVDKVKGIKVVGNIKPILEDNLDVIFISYNEPNADENWQRVLKKAPWAKRVHGVKGIFEAHKAAAKLAKTDMFYVVDGDAWLVDEWEFDFNPKIFDRDCAYVWSSKNPINGLIYQNGGVKLFPKQTLLKKKKWTTLDMFTGIMPKIKPEERVSCLTKFNVDSFSTWRSAFRECVKLYVTNQMAKLHSWTTKGKNKKFGKYAIEGAKAAELFAKENINNYNELLKINDYEWLRNKFSNKV